MRFGNRPNCARIGRADCLRRVDDRYRGAGDRSGGRQGRQQGRRCRADRARNGESVAPNGWVAVNPHRARSLARRLALQALYQLQINPRPWQDTERQFTEDPEALRVDREYFRELMAAIAPNREALDSRLAPLCEIPPAD